jgi:hypothetical protein
VARVPDWMKWKKGAAFRETAISPLEEMARI